MERKEKKTEALERHRKIDTEGGTRRKREKEADKEKIRNREIKSNEEKQKKQTEDQQFRSRGGE